jgi:hypothetical protein
MWIRLHVVLVAAAEPTALATAKTLVSKTGHLALGNLQTLEHERFEMFKLSSLYSLAI